MKKEYLNKWIYNGDIVEEIPENVIGFVYLITNLSNNRFYVGRKNTTSTVTKPPLKGQTKKRKITTESNWKDYWSSSDELKEDVLKFGENQFKREILYFCKSLAVITYLEQKVIFIKGCLETELSYNSWADVKVRKSNIIGKL